MTTRERSLTIAVLGFIVLAGGALMAWQFIGKPLRNRSNAIAGVKKDIEEKQAQITRILAAKPKLETWQKLSLPADLSLARLEYEKFLSGMLRQSGFDANSLIVTPKPLEKTSLTKKEPIFTRLTFTVVGHAELADLVDFLDRFYKTPLLHEVKSMDVRRPLTPSTEPQSKNALDITMSIEALVLSGADKRNQLLPGADRKLLAADLLSSLCGGPAGLALVPWAMGPTGPLGPGLLATPSRQYANIAGKDIFFGPPAAEKVAEQVEAAQFVFLTDITRSGAKAEAFLYDRYNNSKIRLRASAGFDSFRIRDSKGDPLVQGKVVRMDERDVIFHSGDKYYSIHVGQNLEEALKHPLSDSELKDLGLATASNSASK